MYLFQSEVSKIIINFDTKCKICNCKTVTQWLKEIHKAIKGRNFIKGTGMKTSVVNVTSDQIKLINSEEDKDDDDQIICTQ